MWNCLQVVGWLALNRGALDYCADIELTHMSIIYGPCVMPAQLPVKWPHP
jgi:hypothetical protein